MSENLKNWGVNIQWENLHIFWTTWGTLVKFSGKTWLVLKVTKKQDFTLSLENKNMENVTTTVKVWNEKTFQDFRFFDFGYREKFLSQFIFVVSEY